MHIMRHKGLSRRSPVLIAMSLVLALGACTLAPIPAPSQTGGAQVDQTPTRSSRQSRKAASSAERRFAGVVLTLEPVAEQACRSRASQSNCDFLIVVDDRPDQPPNAFQTVTKQGQPVLAFTLSMIDSVDNPDELAFVMGHEAAHHILDHLDRTQQNAVVGATLFSGIAAIAGADAASVRSLEQLGASVGARSYSKNFELEADRLGTLIALEAGYDPVLGAQYFNRIPDPGDRFLGTHPPNRSRMDIVRRTVAELGQ